MKSEISNIPLSDRLTRERTFRIVASSVDPVAKRSSVMHQIYLTLEQLMDEKFTGQIVLHCSQGGVNNITATQSQKVT